jgi:hypothetical protein
MVVAAPLRLNFQHAGQFVGRVLWLGPAPTAELLAHHAQVHARLTRAGVDLVEHYQPGRWVPHCTLSMRVPNALMAAAVRRCLEVLPLEATVSAPRSPTTPGASPTLPTVAARQPPVGSARSARRWCDLRVTRPWSALPPAAARFARDPADGRRAGLPDGGSQRRRASGR